MWVADAKGPKINNLYQLVLVTGGMLELPEDVRALKEEFEDIICSLDKRRIRLKTYNV